MGDFSRSSSAAPCYHQPRLVVPARESLGGRERGSILFSPSLFYFCVCACRRPTQVPRVPREEDGNGDKAGGRPPFLEACQGRRGSGPHDGAVSAASLPPTSLSLAARCPRAMLFYRPGSTANLFRLSHTHPPPPSRPLGSCSDPPRPTATKCFNQLPVPPLEPSPSPRLADVLRRASLGPYQVLVRSYSQHTHRRL